MEPPLKRLRLFEPNKSTPTLTLNSDAYSDLYGYNENALEAEEDEQEEDDYENDGPGDPDAQLEQTRAQLDLSLKSKFEAIFEKYGRDFTGIGDEIDLRTGEIVVNNGHLLEMEDERDDGTGRPSLLEAFTQEPDETFGSTETDDDEQDEVNESHIKLGDMEEDDMILFSNPTVPADRQETPPPHSGSVRDLQPDQQEEDRAAAVPKTYYPSENGILAQFFQESGPKIARHISQQEAQDDSIIEPAWRTPGLPSVTPGKRPILRSILLQPEIDRSPSPKGSSSVWAPKKPRGRPRRDGADIAAVFRGETIIRDRTWYSSGYVSTTVTKKSTQRVDPSVAKRTMNVPLNETITSGKHRLDPSPWAQSRQTESSEIYGINGNSDQEPDSSDEKVIKSYKPRRSWSNSTLPLEQRTSGNSNLQPNQAHHTSKDGFSSKRSRRTRVPFTDADDRIVLQWVDEALKKGSALWSPAHWKMLAEKNPRHSQGSWKLHYRRRFCQNGVMPSIREENIGKPLKTGTDLSRPVPQTVCDSQSELEEDASSDEGSPEMLQDAPPTRTRTLSGESFSQRDPGKDLNVGAIDLDVLDPALHPPKVSGCITRDEPVSLWQQRSKLLPSSPLEAERGVSNPCLQSDGMLAVECPQASSVPQKTGFGAESLSVSSRDAERQTHEASETDRNHHKITTLCNIPRSGIENPQIMLSTDRGVATKEARIFQEGQTLQQIPHKNFGSSYDFSDEEDEGELVQAHCAFRFRGPETINNRHPVNTQIIDLTAEQSLASNINPPDRRVLKGPARNSHHPPISISSPSSAGDLSEHEEDKFFLEPTTPQPPVSDTNMTLSDILGPDDFEELRKGSPASSKKSPEEKGTEAASQEIRNGPLNGVRSTPARNQTPKRRTPISTTRGNLLRRSMEASPGNPTIETPGGSRRRCGENGFRCGKGFCFKCLEG